MTTSRVTYHNSLRCEWNHTESGVTIWSDAPKDNRGQGACFSPTDLLATSLAGCMLTIMGIYCLDRDIPFKGSFAKVTKVMSQELPRRVSEIQVHIEVISPGLSQQHKQGLQKAAQTCPVALSLSPEIKQTIAFEFRT